MYYSKAPFEYIGKDSHIVGDRVFCGQYWDDLSVAGLLCPSGGSILMLGLGRGAAIRSILAVNPSANVTAVDSSSESISATNQIFQTHFPRLNFETVRADALSYLQSVSQKFDVILVDLFTETGYVALAADNLFLRSLSNSVNPDGVVLFNSYGCPAHLVDRSETSFENYLAAQIQRRFDYLFELPHRKNRTLLASNRNPIRQFTHIDSEFLNEEDKIFARTISFRLRYVSQVEQANSKIPSELDFQSMNRSTMRKWEDFYHNVNAVLQDLGEPGLNKLGELFDLVQNEALSRKLLCETLKYANNPIAIFYPTFIAAESNNHDLKVDWFIQWFFENSDHLRSHHFRLYTHHFLPQILAMVLQPSGRFRNEDNLKNLERLNEKHCHY